MIVIRFKESNWSILSGIRLFQPRLVNKVTTNSYTFYNDGKLHHKIYFEVLVFEKKRI